jgi:hypothetical protein
MRSRTSGGITIDRRAIAASPYSRSILHNSFPDPTQLVNVLKIVPLQPTHQEKCKFQKSLSAFLRAIN